MMQQSRDRKRESKAKQQNEVDFIPGPVPSSDFEIPTAPIAPLERKQAIHDVREEEVEAPKSAQEDVVVKGEETVNAIDIDSVVLEDKNAKEQEKRETKKIVSEITTKESSVSYKALKGVINVGVDEGLIPDREVNAIEEPSNVAVEEKPNLSVENELLTDIEKRNEERIKWVESYAKRSSVEKKAPLIEGLPSTALSGLDAEDMSGLRVADSEGTAVGRILYTIPHTKQSHSGLAVSDLKGLDSLEGGLDSKHMEGLSEIEGQEKEQKEAVTGVSNIGSLGLNQGDMEGLDMTTMTSSKREEEKQQTVQSQPKQPWWKSRVFGGNGLYQPLATQPSTEAEVPVAAYAPQQQQQQQQPQSSQYFTAQPQSAYLQQHTQPIQSTYISQPAYAPQTMNSEPISVERVPAPVLTNESRVDPRIRAGSGYLHAQPDFSGGSMLTQGSGVGHPTARMAAPIGNRNLQEFNPQPIRQGTQHNLLNTGTNIQAVQRAVNTTHSQVDMPGARLNDLNSGLQYYYNDAAQYNQVPETYSIAQAPLNTLPSVAPQKGRRRREGQYDEVELQPIMSSQPPSVTTNLPSLQAPQPTLSSSQPVLQGQQPVFVSSDPTRISGGGSELNVQNQHPRLQASQPVLASVSKQELADREREDFEFVDYPVYQHAYPIAPQAPASAPTLDNSSGIPISTPSGSVYYATPTVPVVSRAAQPAVVKEKWEAYPPPSYVPVAGPFPPDLKENAFPRDMKDGAYPPDLKDNAYPISPPVYYHGQVVHSQAHRTPGPCGCD